MTDRTQHHTHEGGTYPLHDHDDRGLHFHTQDDKGTIHYIGATIVVQAPSRDYSDHTSHPFNIETSHSSWHSDHEHYGVSVFAHRHVGRDAYGDIIWSVNGVNSVDNDKIGGL